MNETFRGELRGLVFQNLFLEELDGDADVSRAAVPRQVKKICQQMVVYVPQNACIWGDRSALAGVFGVLMK